MMFGMLPLTQTEPYRLGLAIGNRLLLSLLANELSEIEVHLCEHLRVRLGAFHALLPDLAVLFDTAELSVEDHVEVLNLFLGPLDASAEHGLREARLEAGHGVAYDAKVCERELPDV
jgi:hypothetical protein